ncbi:MAG TPA: gluconate 2-dehydrogenase subunit 3 family protein [Longimicrobiales bacterium]|nr:gluconate 2-dehydrogenase subunit 3 family protein [Longimicrobiales bacterium]
MSEISRRDMLGMIGAAPLAASLGLSPADVERASRRAQEVKAARDAAPDQEPEPPAFFTPAEFRTVRVLADLIIPKDARSGSASDAAVPEFIDFTVSDRPFMQIPVRGGLRWLDAESHDRHGAAFADLTEAQQEGILNDIAWPALASPEMGHGVAFFNRFRDLVASGFWSSKMGIEDLDYRGNLAVPAWNGCPPEALAKLGVSYDLMERRR